MFVRSGKIIIILSCLLLSAGCSIKFNTGGTEIGSNDAGVYKSTNQGDSWQQKTLIPSTTGKAKSFAAVDINALVIDPSDEKAIYAGSEDNGLFYSYDSASDWWQASSLDKIAINAIAVDPKEKCTIYIATANKVMKTEDCSRSWTPTYFDNDLEEVVTNIAIDHYDNRNIYVGISRGEIIKSADRGLSWRSLNGFGDKIKEIAITPSDSRVVFVATEKKGIFRTNDGGNHWTDISDSLKGFTDSLNFRDLAMTKARTGLVLLATKYGMLKSVDNGGSWLDIKLLTTEKNPNINSMAIDPDDENKIYYTTNTTFYKSSDGGETWTTKKLPTTRAGWKLLIDQRNSDTLYLAAKEVKTSQFGN